MVRQPDGGGQLPVRMVQAGRLRLGQPDSVHGGTVGRELYAVRLRRRHLQAVRSPRGTVLPGLQVLGITGLMIDPSDVPAPLLLGGAGRLNPGSPTSSGSRLYPTDGYAEYRSNSY